MKQLYDLIESHEDWLVRRILYYAGKHNYVKYTSTLEEAWRKSIAGLSHSLLAALHDKDSAPDLGPDDDFTRDPVASFGILEAKRHRHRGVTLEMFMGLMKYYRQSYTDLIRQAGFDRDYEERCRLFVEHVFDRIEIGFCAEWAKKSEGGMFAELQSRTRDMANEKNKYLTVLESLPNPVILLDTDNHIDTMNFAASALFRVSGAPGTYYYNEEKMEKDLPWLTDELVAFTAGNDPEISFEKDFKNDHGIRHFEVKLAKMLDVSGKFKGTVVILNDITDRKHAQVTLEFERQRFYSLLEGIPAIIYLQMPDYFICYANRYFRERFGDPGKRPCYEILQGREKTCLNCPALRVFDTGQPLKWEWSGLDGRTYQMQAYPFSDFGGSPMLLVLGTDITKHILYEETLEKSRNFYLTLFEEFPALIWQSGIDAKCNYFNSNWLKFTGRAMDQETGDGWAEGVHPEDINRCLKTYLDSFHARKPFEMDYRLRRHDGEYRWVLDFGRPFNDLDNNFAGYIGSCYDITDHRLLEEALRESEAKYRGIFNSATDGIFIFDLEGKIIEANPQACKMYGYSYENLIQLSAENIFKPGFYHLNGDMSTEVLSARKDGTPIFVEIRGTSIEYKGKKHLLSIVRDITKRKQAEEALSLYQLLFKHARDIFLFVSPDGRILDANNAAVLTYGYWREELLSLTIDDLRATESNALITQQISLESENGILFEAVHRRKDGSTFPVEVSSQATTINNEHVLLCVVRDITDRREMEREMIRLERLNLVGEMAAGIGHEIRNPMTTVRGFLQLLTVKEEYDQYREWFDLMIEELDRANSIIREYLSLAKNKSMNLKFQNLNSILKDLSPLFTSDAMQSNMNVILETGDVQDLFLDENEIRQLVLNLVRNGLEAMSAGGSLTIRTFVDGSEVVLSVQDQGAGIEPHVLEKIGTPFFTTKDSGTGLGLAVCYSIATRHNAAIKVETGPTGTTFFIRFRM